MVSDITKLVDTENIKFNVKAMQGPQEESTVLGKQPVPKYTQFP